MPVATKTIPGPYTDGPDVVITIKPPHVVVPTGATAVNVSLEWGLFKWQGVMYVAPLQAWDSDETFQDVLSYAAMIGSKATAPYATRIAEVLRSERND